MPDAAGGCFPAGERTWTVLGRDHRVVGPAEEFLEYLRVQGASPNTVKSYARALALWWTVPGGVRPALGCADAWRTWAGSWPGCAAGDGPQVISIERRRGAVRASRRSARAAAGGDLLLPVTTSSTASRWAGTWYRVVHRRPGGPISRCWSTWPAGRAVNRR